MQNEFRLTQHNNFEREKRNEKKGKWHCRLERLSEPNCATHHSTRIEIARNCSCVVCRPINEVYVPRLCSLSTSPCPPFETPHQASSFPPVSVCKYMPHVSGYLQTGKKYLISGRIVVIGNFANINKKPNLGSFIEERHKP